MKVENIKWLRGLTVFAISGQVVMDLLGFLFVLLAGPLLIH
jgi:hypothetical protein